MGDSPWIPGVSPDRRAGGDRRIAGKIECQEALARIVVDTRGEDSYAGRALQELQRRRATAPRQGPLAPIIYSLRGRWIVGTVDEVRAEMVAEAQAACRRRSSAAAALAAGEMVAGETAAGQLAAEQMAAELPPGSDRPQ